MEYLIVCTVLLYFLPVHYPLITSANWRKLPKLGSQTISTSMSAGYRRGSGTGSRVRGAASIWDWTARAGHRKNGTRHFRYPGDTSNSWVGLNQTVIAERLIIANWDHSDQNGTQGKQMTNSIEFFGNILGMQQLLCGCALAIAHTAI